MRRIWAICRFEIQRVFKKPASYALMFGMPLLFTFIFGSLLGDSGAVKTKLAVIDMDRSAVSESIINRLTQDDMLEIQKTDATEAEDRLKQKKVAGIVTVPAGYQRQLATGEKAEVAFRHGPDLAIAPAIRQTIDNAMARSAIQIQAAQSWGRYSGDSNWQGMFDRLTTAEQSNSVTVVSQTVSKGIETKRMNNLSERAVGFSIMFLMITLMTVTGTILEARKSGVWYRMLAAPASRFQIMAGYLSSFFLTGWLQFGILMAVSSLFFGIHWGNLAGQIVLVSALLLCIVGMGLFIAGLVKTSEQQSVLSNILVVSTCMLGGVYWPLDIVPDVMRTIAEFVPQTWAMRGFTELVSRGGSLPDILGPVAVLLGFAAVFLVAGISRVRYE